MMRISTVTITLIYLCFPFLSNATASSNKISKTDSIIFRAMQDEMNRNMNELTDQDNPKPFFISYTISDANTLAISSSNGALINSGLDHVRGWSARVMVGDYKVNDENYRGSDIPMNGNDAGNVSMPLDDDYYGIRRALWKITNNIYKSASASYKSKINVLKENNTNDSLLLDDFSKEPPVELIQSSEQFKLDKTYYENLSRDLSSIFREFPEIYLSSVTIGAVNNNIYFVNSEGAKIKTPQNIFELSVMAVLMNEKGEYIPASLVYNATSPDDIPSKKLLTDDIKLLIAHLSDLKSAPTFNDSYNGPVLIQDHAIAGIFLSELFSGNNSLIASREALYSNMNMGMYYGEGHNDMEKKLGKKLTGINLSVTALPHLKEYNSTKLSGAFSVDAEGVIPPEKIVLIENSFLKNLLNGRTPTRAVKKSNGHNRYITNFGYVSKSIAPGVIKVTSTDSRSYNELKKELLKKALNDGYDYAIIVKSIKQGKYQYPNAFYKVDVNTGEEKLVRSALIGNSPYDFLRNISGFSDNTSVFNMLYNKSTGLLNNYMAMFNNSLIDGTPVSLIMPDALLLKNIKIEGVNSPITNIGPTVSPPELE